MPDPETVVRSFFAAWPRRNMEEVLGYFTDDALYHNMPLEPVTGKDGIREILNMFLFSDQLEAELLHVATLANVVFMEIRNGKIAAWRDYFDLATWQRQTGQG